RAGAGVEDALRSGANRPGEELGVDRQIGRDAQGVAVDLDPTADDGGEVHDVAEGRQSSIALAGGAEHPADVVYHAGDGHAVAGREGAGLPGRGREPERRKPLLRRLTGREVVAD